MLAAYTYNSYPLIFDLTDGEVRQVIVVLSLAVLVIYMAFNTDGFTLSLHLFFFKVHHLLQVRGSEVYEWTDLTPRQAYWKQAELLNSNMALAADRHLNLESIDEDLQVPMKKLRLALRGTDGLKEQLDSIIPFLPWEERIEVTMAMINAWSPATPQQLQLPEAVQMLYA
jgi:hypothetical protein